MASQQQAGGDPQQQQQPQYVQMPTEAMQQQQQQPSSSLGATAAGTTAGNYPAFDLGKFWNEQMHLADLFESDFKNHPLPLARIKKVMKTDQEVKMISAEAPVLFAKGCEIFITELTKRAWVHAEENKRRTLQRSDIATAISKTDMCDFLIDIVPREEAVKSQSVPFDQQQQQQQQQQAAQQQPEYGYYAAPQGAIPQYAPQQMDSAYAYQQLTAEQMQQYQLQLQQFATQQHQQQHPSYQAPPSTQHGATTADSSTSAQPNTTITKTE